jgi:hypothetical protein
MTEKCRRGCKISLSIVHDDVDGNRDMVGHELILDDTKKEAILGRLEIIVAMHKTCGCDSNAYSMNNKCDACSVVSRWASKSLSLKGTLRFSEMEGRISLQARGCHVVILADKQRLNEHGNTWGERMDLTQTNSLLLRPKHGDSPQGALRIRVSVVRNGPEYTPAICDQVEEKSANMESIGVIVAENSLRVLREAGSAVRLPMQPDAPAAFSRPVVTTSGKRPASLISKEDVTIFLVPLGRELPSSRRKEIEKKAVLLGMKVARDIRRSSHLVISPDVQTLVDVAQAAGISEEELRTVLEQVRMTSSCFFDLHFEKGHLTGVYGYVVFDAEMC